MNCRATATLPAAMTAPCLDKLAPQAGQANASTALRYAQTANLRQVQSAQS